MPSLQYWDNTVLKYPRLKKKHKIFSILVVVAIVYLFPVKKIHVEHIEVCFPDLPAELDGFRIVQLSDLHLPKNISRIEAILRHVSEQSPDIVVMTGDMISSDATISQTGLQEFCEALVQIADVYAVSGNHEIWLDRKGGDWETVLSNSGVHVIDNSSVAIGALTLVGLSDGQPLKRTFPGLTIVLSHRPTVVRSRRPIEGKADLMFSGHAHGGLLRIPFMGGVIAPDQCFFPNYTSGLYEHPGGSKLVMSRGLGNSILPLRSMNNRPHIPVVILRVQEM